MRTQDIWNVCLQTYRNNRICSKVACFLRKAQTSPVKNWKILRFENAKFSEYYYYMNPNI